MLSSVLGDTCGRAVSLNSSAFALCFFAELAADGSLRPIRALGFAPAARVRPPGLRPLAFDFPRLICRRPIDSVGRNANLTHLSCSAHASERPAHNRDTYNKTLRAIVSGSTALRGVPEGDPFVS
jgi:hypothetical protein